MNQDLLTSYGFDNEWRDLFTRTLPELEPARVIAQHKTQYILITGEGEARAQISGRYRNELFERGGYPAVGDMVGIRRADTSLIEAFLPRRTLFRRLDSFRGTSQPLAANVDTAVICLSLGQLFKVARLTRFVIMAKESGAMPVIALTKADTCEDIEASVKRTRAAFPGIPVHAISALSGQGIDDIRAYFSPGKTLASLGFSGVGKSTLLNALFGETVMKTSAVREDDERGRHTTVHRQLILLPQGGLYMDTPGLRELGLFDAQQSVDDTYEDVARLTGMCRFSDCKHVSEPGCAVLAAIESGEITEQRWLAYKSLLRESRPRKDIMMEKWQRSMEISKNARKLRKHNPHSGTPKR